ncbi:MAG: DegT/DnrJ/EryC1/StrS family aminotransferase, partial [Ottowia sp.]|nr:DegT/DnrJ/EryC1/StrS family aminotransferase [Ottowia sp.]
MIRAAQPLLPDMEEFLPYLREIWESRMLTNNGALHARLEQALKARLMVERLQLTANATLGLMCALRALQVSGRVITTPFTFVATVHALRWCGLEPVFADIDPDTLNLDPDRAAAAVGPGVTAILPVHCFGTPCDTTRLGLLARHHGLKLIYDAAHAFDVSDAGGSILRHGDASVVSFHATKVFSTSEGGAVVSATADTADRVARCRNFGFTADIDTDELGLNAKLGE